MNRRQYVNERNELIWMITSILIFVVAIIISMNVSTGDSVEVPWEEYPVYGSKEQYSLNGWMQLTITELSFLGTAETSTRTRMTGTSLTTDTKWAIYAIKDDQGNSLLLRSPEMSTSPGIVTVGRHGEGSLPLHMYVFYDGKADEVFRDYQGASSALADYCDLDVVTEERPSANKWQRTGATRYIKNETGTTIVNICYVVAGIALVSFFLIGKKKRNF